MGYEHDGVCWTAWKIQGVGAELRLVMHGARNRMHIQVGKNAKARFAERAGYRATGKLEQFLYRCSVPSRIGATRMYVGVADHRVGTRWTEDVQDRLVAGRTVSKLAIDQ